MFRTQPNIIVTGTPGVGKTSHCNLLAQNTDLVHLCINQVVKERSCHHGWDEAFKCWIVDDDKVYRESALPRSTAKACCSLTAPGRH